ncbi:MAG: hypothetical protein HYY05_08405 [Chloroflexi bacterium]|nr:hypothetical protein [Chloroflexota bacterium]
MSRADELLEGAVDMHVHGYPEIALEVRQRLEDVQVLEGARAAGMRGIVLKSHLWPTMGRAYQLRERVPGVDVYPSITLNPVCGGLSPWAVERAARLGGRVVFMPTWSARNDLRRGGMSARFRHWFGPSSALEETNGLQVLDEQGRLVEPAAEILRLALEEDLVLSTGHLSVEESLALAREARAIGFRRLIFGHPFASLVGATIEVAREMASLGATIELVAQGAFNPASERSFPPARVAAVVRELGPDHCLLATDSFLEWPPPPAEFLRLFLAALLALDMEPGWLRTMVRDNPARLLD